MFFPTCDTQILQERFV